MNKTVNQSSLCPSQRGGRGAFVTDSQRWAAVVRRDSRAAGAFCYGVETTGVFCRPGCRSRLPLRPNVSFYRDAAAAAAAGFRPCKRCQPELRGSACAPAIQIQRACRLIETADRLPSLSELAQAAGMSASHFHRVFKRALGLTPREYAAAHRLQRFRSELRRGRRVTDAIFDAGFGSSSRAYEGVSAKLGMTPGALRNGAAGEVIRFVTRRSPLGWVLVAGTDKGVCAILLGDDPAKLRSDLAALFPRARLVNGAASLGPWVGQILASLSSPGSEIELPLDIRGTAFQLRVWEALRRIPRGRTSSYRDLALALGSPRAVRAVGRACAANKIAVAIPCHRAVRADGGISGYRWGVARKRALLEGERRLGTARGSLGKQGNQPGRRTGERKRQQNSSMA